METPTADDESTIITNTSEFASWNRARTNEELRSFINSHHLCLPDDSEME